MSFIFGILAICFFIGLFNLVMRILFGIGWAAWQLLKVLAVIAIIAIILGIIGNCI